MAEIKLTIPDAALPRIRDAFCAEFNYQSTLDDGTPNPQTKAAFTKAKVIEYVKQVTRNYEGNISANTARQTVSADIESISIT